MRWGVRYSAFVHFPVLFFALFGYAPFARRHSRELVLLAGFSLVQILVHGLFFNPFGEWAYGPRYLLPICPLLSLPFLCAMEWLLANYRKVRARAAGVVIAATLAWSCRLQLNVNALPFFVYYQLRDGLFEPFKEPVPEVENYFENRPFGMVNGDLFAWKAGHPWKALQLLEPGLNVAQRRALEAALESYLAPNYYWFPGPPGQMHPAP